LFIYFEGVGFVRAISIGLIIYLKFYNMTEVRKTKRMRRSGFGEIPCVHVVREVLNIIN
jgi:hypothetical protein